MRYLILSDLHANWEALQAALREAAGLYDRILCCGDLAGYGPDPNAVVDWVREHVHALVRGNHDRGCAGIDDLEDFNPIARMAAEWTLIELTNENRTYLAALPPGPACLEGFQLVHGSPFDEDEYVVSTAEAREVLRRLEVNLVFFGHTHQQRIFTWRRGRFGALAGPGPRQPGVCLGLDADAAYLINPGSVGQPRDGDPRAAWAVYDSDPHEILLSRTAYDSEPTRRKIRAAGLPDLLAARLTTGR